MPKGRRKKLTTAIIADADYLLQEERETEEREQVKEQRARKLQHGSARVQSSRAEAGGGRRAGASSGRYVVEQRCSGA